MNDAPTIAVTGVGGGVGQSILRALRLSEAGYRILGLDMNPFSAGLYQCDRALTVPPCDHEDYLPRMTDILREEGVSVLMEALKKTTISSNTSSVPAPPLAVPSAVGTTLLTVTVIVSLS